MSRKLQLYLFLFLALNLALTTRAQKVGVVLSGGGASALAHIGVLQALEENNIPIDYITGTSMGALIGSMYAIGYSPKRIAALISSDDFKDLAYGNISRQYTYHFKKNDENSSWFTFKISLDSSLETTLPTNIISPTSMDFALLEIFSQASAQCGYNFDSLFVPYRCVASDIEAKESIVFKNGDLGEAVRASITYPFYIKPIVVNGKLLFDGGLYNNFPSDVMYDDFFPDYIIGSNVTGNAPPPSEGSLVSQIRNLLVSKTNYSVVCESGIMIEPKTDIGFYNFDDPQVLIDSGYVATIRQIEHIKQCVSRTSPKEALDKKRELFFNSHFPLLFDRIYIDGLNHGQASYIRGNLRHKNKKVTIDELKPAYFRLAADDKIKQIYPKAKFNRQTGYYDLHLKILKEKDIITYVGGNFSNRPISEGFLGIQYNYLGRAAIGVYGNAYFGKLYNSVQFKPRIDFPYKVPFYVEPNFTFNRWDFYRSSNAFYKDTRPAYLLQREQYAGVDIGIPAGISGKIVTGTAHAYKADNYYQTRVFTQLDTTDRTSFNVFTSHLYYEMNSLNRKQYASAGTYFMAKARYLQGKEFNQPGSTSADESNFFKHHEWIQFKLVFDKYLKQKGNYRFGIYAEGVYSTQTLFNNFTASILSAPSFEPVPETKTIFLENYRAHKYVAGGLKNIISLRKNIDFRLEGYIFMPHQAIIKDDKLKAIYGGIFDTKHYIASATAVYHTPLGPFSLNVNYYDKPQEPFSYTFLFHFGYILFNKRALD